MLDSVIEAIQQFLLNIFRLPELVVMFISIVPIVEVRLAIPIAIGYNLNPFLGGLYAFLGSCLIVPILLLVLLPFINWLSKTKIFKKVGDVIYEKFEKRSKSISAVHDHKPLEEMNDAEKAEYKALMRKLDLKKMLGVFVFVAIPMPLTGVWTGSAVAAIVKLPFRKALISIIAGNLVAASLITLLCVFFASYINIIILVISIIAVIVVIALIVKIIISKPKKADTQESENKE